jgi:hypothetical protein
LFGVLFLFFLIKHGEEDFFFGFGLMSSQSLVSRILSLFVQIVLNAVGAIPNSSAICFLDLYPAFTSCLLHQLFAIYTAFLLPEDAMLNYSTDFKMNFIQASYQNN